MSTRSQAAPTRVYLADLAHDYSVDDSSLTVPLGIGYVKAYAVADHGNGITVELFKHPERLLARAAAAPPDIIGFANYGWNDNLNRTIGRYLRQQVPDALFVAGGPNVDPEEARRRAFLDRHDYLDFLIVDGGEEPFSELIHWWRDRRGDLESLPANLLWRDGDALRCTGERPLSKIIDNIPSPYLDGYLDEFLEAGMVPMFETNRGCPFRCTFCAWGMASKDLVRRLDLDTALAEIDYVGGRSQASNWLVCDANFGILKRDVEIAKAIRGVKDRHGKPERCHVWLAKNVTERNLEIGEILREMTVPVMAVQSLDDEVLARIKRDNISTDTYVEYQQKFHAIGSRTYSDLIVPLPAETLESHKQAIRNLFDYGVDIIQNHNMRLLAGAETNSTETRETYSFRTRFRLIHGDAGIYRAPDGTELRCFEYEESLRATTTMSEAEMFHLRKLHFLVDFCWNIDVYKPLLKVLQFYGVNPVNVLERLIEPAEGSSNGAAESGLGEFWRRFEQSSREEWFDSAEEIEAYFAEPRNFESLINQDFEKLNILFSIVILKDYKQDFDRAMRRIALGCDAVPGDIVTYAADLTFAAFPPLEADIKETVVQVPANFCDLHAETYRSFRPSRETQSVRLVSSEGRRRFRDLFVRSKDKTLSKVLNTQGIGLRDLKLTTEFSFGFDQQFRRTA